MGYGTVHPSVTLFKLQSGLNDNYLIVQVALQGATDYSFNSTVELNKTYILSNSTVGFISFTIGLKNRLTNSTVGAIQTLHSTVQLNQNTHFNTIFESTWHHNRHLSSLAK